MCGIQLVFNHSARKSAEYPPVFPFKEDAVKHRGPDEQSVFSNDNVSGIFHRLYVHNRGAAQPIKCEQSMLVCNGEIYNYAALYASYDLTPSSVSDCAIIMDLHRDGFEPLDIVDKLDGEYAFCLWTGTKLVCARDPTGVRPLYYLELEDMYVIASEPILPRMEPILPSHVYEWDMRGNLVRYGRLPPWRVQLPPLGVDYMTGLYTALRKSVFQSRMGNARKGCFLSGGLDSSIVASLLEDASCPGKEDDPIEYFTIGIEGSIDIAYARQVAAHLGVSDRHHVYTFTVEEGLSALDEVIDALGTYDITTIRASIPQYLLCEQIRCDFPDIKVLFSGEGSDELFAGYQYSALAPSENALDRDRTRLLEQLHLFDNLRIDRVTAAFGFEARVPFLSSQQVLREACRFPPREGKTVLRALPFNLPVSVLKRPKQALSDAVSSASTCWFRELKAYVESTHGVSEKEYYWSRYVSKCGNRVLPKYWMPQWTDTDDPSATTLTNFVGDDVQVV